MIKLGFFLFAILGIALSSSGQQIYMEKTLSGARFETDTLTLSLRQVTELIQDNPAAYHEFKKAKLNYSISGVFGFAGGVLVALPLVTAVIGGKPEWGFAAAGGALILVSIPFTRGFHRRAENALEDYNAKYQTRRMKANFYVTGVGGKLVIRF